MNLSLSCWLFRFELDIGPEDDDPPDTDPRSTTASTIELAEPKRVGFTGGELPDHDHDGRKRR